MVQLHASYMVVICFMPHYKGVGAYFDAFLNLSVTCQLHASYMALLVHQLGRQNLPQVVADFKLYYYSSLEASCLISSNVRS